MRTWLIRQLDRAVAWCERFVEDTEPVSREADMDPVCTTPHTCSARSVIEQVIGRDIAYYDSSKLTYAEQKNYYAEAQRILRSPVFVNEVKHFVADLVTEIAKKAPNWQTVEFLRATINGQEALVERLGEIPNPEKRVPSDSDLYDGV